MFKKLFFDFEEYKIEKFQLQNLATSMVPYKYYALDKLNPQEQEFKILIDRSEYQVDPIANLVAENVAKEFPVLFICLKGKKSKKAVKQAAQLGFKNIYFLEGGFQSLVKS